MTKPWSAVDVHSRRWICLEIEECKILHAVTFDSVATFIKKQNRKKPSCLLLLSKTVVSTVILHHVVLLNFCCRENIPLRIELYYRSENDCICCLIDQWRLIMKPSVSQSLPFCSFDPWMDVHSGAELYAFFITCTEWSSCHVIRRE